MFNNVKLLRLKRWARVASSMLADRDANKATLTFRTASRWTVDVGFFFLRNL